MKLRETLLAFVLIASAVGWVSPVFSQDQDSDVAIRGDHQRDAKRLLSRALQNPDRAPEGIRQEIVALRESQELVRNAWVGEYRPEKGASLAEVQEARERFQADYAETIKQSREMRVRVLNRLREGAREAIDDSEWNEEARALYSEYKAAQRSLDLAWREEKAGLGDEVTRRQVSAARRRFEEANADLIAKQKELAVAVRQLVRGSRDDTALERDPLPPELEDLRREMASIRQQLGRERRLANEEMRGMSRREREEYRRNVLEELKELHDQIKERRRRFIDELRDGQSGDRRPEG